MTRKPIKPSPVSKYSIFEQMYYRGWPQDHAPAPMENTGPFQPDIEEQFFDAIGRGDSDSLEGLDIKDQSDA